MDKFQEYLDAAVWHQNNRILIIEGYRLQDFQRLLQKAKVPFDIINGTLSIPSRFYDEVSASIAKLKGAFEQNDAGDKITVRMA